MLEIKPVKPNTAELNDFLALPKQIYQPDHLMQSEEEELTLIEGSHPLSSDIETYGFYWLCRQSALYSRPPDLLSRG